MLGWTQILRRFPWQEELRLQALDAIERGVSAQTRLIEDLLDASRMISGKLRIEVQTVELMPLLQAAIEIARPSAEAKAVGLQCLLSPRVGLIKGDPARLQQIFRNLLSNAIKFTPNGGTITRRLAYKIVARGSRRNLFLMFLIGSARRIVPERGLTVVSAWGLPSSNILLNFTVETFTPKAQVKAKVRQSVSSFPLRLFTRILTWAKRVVRLIFPMSGCSS